MLPLTALTGAAGRSLRKNTSGDGRDGAGATCRSPAPVSVFGIVGVSGAFAAAVEAARTTSLIAAAYVESLDGGRKAAAPSSKACAASDTATACNNRRREGSNDIEEV